MLAFGICVVGRFDGERLEQHDLREQTFYRELRPVGTEVDPDALRVARLDRDELLRSGSDPEVAMQQATTWIQRAASADRPVFVGYPVVFDWMFMHWYFIRFAGSSPFGFSNALDMKTMYQQKARVPLDLAGRDDLPAKLRSDLRHSHNALDDAIEQGEIFAKLFEWRGNGR
jgi:hypothetical protein